MIAISWNCRGLGHLLAIPSLCELVRVHRPHFIFLCETLAQRQRIEEVRVRLNFEGCFSIDCVGRSGGICMLWRNSASCNMIGYSQNHINMKITDTIGEWRLTSFYGFPERHRRRDSWNLLRRLSATSSLPWVILGDFNDLLNQSDKRGRVDHPNWLLVSFRSAVMDSGLLDLSMSGY